MQNSHITTEKISANTASSRRESNINPAIAKQKENSPLASQTRRMILSSKDAGEKPNEGKNRPKQKSKASCNRESANEI
jgi:hypothetical protein